MKKAINRKIRRNKAISGLALYVIVDDFKLINDHFASREVATLLEKAIFSPVHYLLCI